MQSIAAKLPSLFDYQVPTDVLPALVLAYNQYKDLDRENEIITRNRTLIPHPGFLPSGDTIELLSA
jgi:prophage DNA circulation protein